MKKLTDDQEKSLAKIKPENRQAFLHDTELLSQRVWKLINKVAQQPDFAKHGKKTAPLLAESFVFGYLKGSVKEPPKPKRK